VVYIQTVLSGTVYRMHNVLKSRHIADKIFWLRRHRTLRALPVLVLLFGTASARTMFLSGGGSGLLAPSAPDTPTLHDADAGAGDGAAMKR